VAWNDPSSSSSSFIFPFFSSHLFCGFSCHYYWISVRTIRAGDAQWQDTSPSSAMRYIQIAHTC
jgi:hypothetical protein